MAEAAPCPPASGRSPRWLGRTCTRGRVRVRVGSGVGVVGVGVGVLIDEVVLDELDRQGRLADASSTNDDQLVLHSTSWAV